MNFNSSSGIKDEITDIIPANLAKPGIVQLTNTIDASEDKAVTPKGVKEAIKNISGGGGKLTDLGDLNDVKITNPQNDEQLIYTDGKWVNKLVQGSGIDKVGNLQDLDTNAKTNVVLSINEVNDKIDQKANDNAVVKLTGDQSINGVKTFTNLPQSAGTPSDNKDLTTKKYVDSKIQAIDITDIRIGELHDLSTTAQDNVVNAINEVNGIITTLQCGKRH